MVDFKAMLGDSYREDMTLSELMKALDDSKKDLVEWNDDKYTTKAKYIALEKQMLDEKSKRKSATEELDGYKKANMTAEEQAKARQEALENEIKALKLEATKSQMRAMYTAQGYSEKIVNELVESDFYEGDDKIAKRGEILKRANEEILSNYKNSILDGTTKPNVATGDTVNTKKEYYKKMYSDALAQNRSDLAVGYLTQAMNEGIDVRN